MTAGPGERFCTVGDVQLCYETFGDAGDPCLLLVMGLGMQLIAWEDEFCRDLAGRGFHVVRFDNRDCGRSTHFDRLAAPTAGQLAMRRIPTTSYTLADLAADAFGLLDHLGVPAAHLAGVSMGAMITQTMAARCPERVLSLASLMGSTGSRRDGQPALRVWPHLLRRVPDDKHAFVAAMVRLFQIVGSPRYPTDETRLRALFAASFDRGAPADGRARQLAAIFAAGNRRPELRRITAPTLVLHGDRDILVTPSGGRATARAIDGARLVVVPGMGHDLARPLWPLLIDEIHANALGTRRGEHTQMSNPR